MTAEELAAEFARLSEDIIDGIDRALVDCGNQVANTAKLSLRSRDDQSVSGLPPRNQTGTLRRSIAVRLEKDLLHRWVRVGTNVRYAIKLERGICCWPHPFMAPALQKNAAKIQAKIRKAIESECS